MTFQLVGSDPTKERPFPVKLKLEKAARAIARVIDEDDKPVEDAKVLFMLANNYGLDGMPTEVPGEYAVLYPPSSTIQSVIARKDKLGADYRTYSLPYELRSDNNAKAPEFPEDGETLRLDGTRPATLKVVTGSGEPLPGADVYPWVLGKGPGVDRISLSGTDSFVQQTNADGLVAFDWMPRWQTSPVTLTVSLDGYARRRAMYLPNSNHQELLVVMNKTVPIRGTVIDAEGKPALGIRVIARGSGHAPDGGSGQDISAEDGTFEMLVPGEQIYLLTVKDETWVTDGVPTFAVNNGSPVEGIELQLREPTVVSGTVTDVKTGDPAPRNQMVVYLDGTPLNELKNVTIANPANSNRRVRPMYHFVTQTDDQGRYELKLGNGDYRISPFPPRSHVDVTVAGEESLTVDATADVIHKVELTGTVRSKSDGLPIANAHLEGVPTEFRIRGWHARTGPDGTFSVETEDSSFYIHAKNEEGTLASIFIIDDASNAVDIELQPVGAAHGVLHQSESDSPAATEVFQYSVGVQNRHFATSKPSFGGTVLTDAEGRFVIENLVPGQEYNLTITAKDGRSRGSLGELEVEAGENRDLGTLKIPAPYKPYVAPTLDERIERAMAVEGTAMERFSRAVPRVQRSKQMLLIALGTISEPRLHDFMQWRYEDSDYRKVRDDYLVMAISTESQEQKEQARELLDELGVKNLDQSIEFSLVLVDADGELIEHVSGKDFIVEEQLSKSQVIDWLDSFRPDPIDARELFETTLTQARKENKRVIVQETATWCGPCHMLSDFLSEHRAWEKDYLWVKMDHRYVGARELMQELRDGAQGGIPWFAIVDADGNRLATSNQGEGGRNIGFPSSEAGQRHLKRMLMQTKLTMTEDEITSFVEHLNDEE
ncbi:thioredoxin [Rhodopirellula baltica]|uniref:Thioredoxin H-type n=1 Tax=Rhodopirellula baltica WH47 TaxID=991778 RepID=F2AWI6_RHOBT|nr:thioredoxin [Rhodopirellula baltica]EGF25977.1 thioredoxin H-type [Rhodopirellula baltica WH47]